VTAALDRRVSWLYRHEHVHFGLDMCLNTSCGRFLMLDLDAMLLTLYSSQPATLNSFEFVI
jgi:hypothetical protein